MESIILAAEESVASILSEDSDLNNRERIDVFKRSLSPLRNALLNLDAESYLNLTRSDTTTNESTDDNTALLNGSIYIRTIHDQIKDYHEGIRYLHLAEKSEHYSIGIFVFPPHAVIPLHNHPGMTVLSRVLYGNLKVKTYDIIPDGNNAEQQNGNSWLPNFVSRVFRDNQNHQNNAVPKGAIHAYANKLKELSSPQITELYPEEGNVHEFTAGRNGAAVLDVLVPPYDADNERDCTFYQEDVYLDTPSDNSGTNYQFDSTRRRCWLVPVKQPEWFYCIKGEYGEIQQGTET
jgi:predicted metal-dependent enzyme (double-stranded beta helix superfamily)